LTTLENKEKVKARVINHEMPFYDPEKKVNLDDLVGIAKVDNAENIDVNEV
jgi:hypothetical protein